MIAVTHTQYLACDWIPPPLPLFFCLRPKGVTEAVHQEEEFFLYLLRELKLLVFAVKGYHAAVNHVLLAEVDLAANQIISRMSRSFEKPCPPREVKPPEWKLSLVLMILRNPVSCRQISTLPESRA